MRGVDYDPFNDFMVRLVDRHIPLLHTATAPTLHDELQNQLFHTARGRLNYDYIKLAREPPPRNPRNIPTNPPGGNPPAADDHPVFPGNKCFLCGDVDHTLWTHPEDKPITIPCRRCHKLHACRGPLATKCSK
jgi:hypothetical protein